MGIKGFQGTSLLDFPGRIASLVFFGRCNLTCPFCHNPALVLEPEAWPDCDEQDLLETLRERSRFIDGVVISGGEPTLDPGLEDFLRRVKALGLAVKLDTNGLAPQRVESLLQQELIDYLAIDLKTDPARYPQLHDRPVAVAALEESVALAMAAQIEVEFRTTCVPGWVDEETIAELGRLISGAPLWAIQQFHAEHALEDATRQLQPYSEAQLRALAKQAEAFASRVEVRGV